MIGEASENVGGEVGEVGVLGVTGASDVEGAELVIVEPLPEFLEFELGFVASAGEDEMRLLMFFDEFAGELGAGRFLFEFEFGDHDEGGVRVEDVFFGANGRVFGVGFLEFGVFVGGERAVFGEATFGEVATDGDSAFASGVEGGLVDAGLAARDDFGREVCLHRCFAQRRAAVPCR